MVARSFEEMFAEMRRTIEEMRMEMRRGFGLDSGIPDNNSGVQEAEDYHPASDGRCSMGTSEEIILECEENQVDIDGENEVELEFITNVVMVGEKDPAEGLRYEMRTDEPDVDNQMKDELKGEGDVEGRSGYSLNAIEVRNLLSHALAKPSHPDSVNVRGWFLNKPAKPSPPDQPPPPVETLNQCPPPKPPDLYLWAPTRRWVQKKPTRFPPLDPPDLCSYVIITFSPPDPRDPCAPTEVRWWTSRLSILFSPSDPSYLLEVSKREKIQAAVGGHVSAVEGERVEGDLGYCLNLMDQAQFGENMKEKWNMDVSVCIPTCKTSIVEAVEPSSDLSQRQLQICTTRQFSGLFDLGIVSFSLLSRLSSPFLRLFGSKARVGKSTCPWWEGQCLFAAWNDIEVLKPDSEGPIRMPIVANFKDDGKEWVMEIVVAFEFVKAYLFENKYINGSCALIRYVNHPIMIKACDGLNGIKLGGEVLKIVHVVHANLDASPTENGGESIFSLAYIAIEEMLKEEQLKTYKFNVDGEWRHDEQQPFVSGNYGVVNIVLGRELNTLPAVCAETPTTSHMEVDNIVFGHVEANPILSESDLEVPRHCLFLSTHIAYELIPKSGKVIASNISLPVKQALHVLYEQGISMAPPWDFCRIQFVGVLNAMGFILILEELGNHGSTLTEEQLGAHTVAAWEKGKLQQHGTLDSNGGSYPWCLVHAGPNEYLKDVALKVLQNKVSTVPTIHSLEDESFPQLSHLASLSGILKCICRHFKYSFGSFPILHLPIASLPWGTWGWGAKWKETYNAKVKCFSWCCSVTVGSR